MRRFTVLVAVLPVIALGACGESSLPTSVVTIPAATTQLQGEVVARNVCAHCHGADFRGMSQGLLITPSLSMAKRYNLEDFNRLLVAGVARDGRTVNPAMGATHSLSENDRQAVFQFLVAVMP